MVIRKLPSRSDFIQILEIGHTRDEQFGKMGKKGSKKEEVEVPVVNAYEEERRILIARNRQRMV